jgi:hypothetical protein
MSDISLVDTPDAPDAAAAAAAPDAGIWTAGLDEETVAHLGNKGYDGLPAFAKGYMDLEKAVGADKIVKPAADSNLLEWDGWSELGTPDEASGYEMAAPEGFEQYDQALANDMRSLFHKARLTPQQAAVIHDGYVERMGNAFAESATEKQVRQDTEVGELKKELGSAFEERVVGAKSVVTEYGGDDVKTVLRDAGLDSNPALVRMFSQIRMALGVGPQFKDGEQSGRFGTTPEMAQEEIAKIRANPALMDKRHAEHKVLNDRLTQLNQLAHGTEVILTTR